MNIGPIRPLFYVDLNASPIGLVYMVDLDRPIRRKSKSTPHIGQSKKTNIQINGHIGILTYWHIALIWTINVNIFF